MDSVEIVKTASSAEHQLVSSRKDEKKVATFFFFLSCKTEDENIFPLTRKFLWTNFTFRGFFCSSGFFSVFVLLESFQWFLTFSINRIFFIIIIFLYYYYILMTAPDSQRHCLTLQQVLFFCTSIINSSNTLSTQVQNFTAIQDLNPRLHVQKSLTGLRLWRNWALWN